jgi:hypothetical protein
MQAQRIEVGLVAKLAGPASAVVTLGHYTQAVRGGEAAVAALERAFAGHSALLAAVARGLIWCTGDDVNSRDSGDE